MAALPGKVRIWHDLIHGGDRKDGLAPTLRIRRNTDGYQYDWNDGTFKASGWTTLDGVATEPDAVNDPGAYYWEVGTGSVVDVFPSAFVDAEYTFCVDESTIPYNASYSYWIRDRRLCWLLAAQLVQNKKKLEEGSSDNMTYYEDDGSSELRIVSVTDKNGGPITLPAGTPAQEA